MSAGEQALRVLIVDDEAPARLRLRDLLTDCGEKMPLEVVGEAASGLEALKCLEEAPADVVLLDIRMPEMDGIELAQHLMKLPDPPAVIFTTAYDAYALQAFDVHALDYLLKPVRLGRLFNALTRARSITPLRIEILQQLARRPRSHLSIQERGRVHLIPVDAILYLKAELKYVTVRTREREYLIEESLSRLEEEFADRFLRIHRNCLVAKNAISGFEKQSPEAEGQWAVVIKELNEKLAVSRRQWSAVKAFMDR
ncbi:LytR/AlgR family response regulator transcription factor [Pelomicrobium sp.]|jgi:two-component system response regulator AlgR|uniref:LytR/AlgR family response regulator transcription factor n=1 Tax=Pelomicrobium sp. TaxID=2815319 RepID=UPI002FDDFB7A